MHMAVQRRKPRVGDHSQTVPVSFNTVQEERIRMTLQDWVDVVGTVTTGMIIFICLLLIASYFKR